MAQSQISNPESVIAFWREAGPERWFRSDPAFDQACRDRWMALHADAAAGRLDDWAATPDGALALLLLLDQMPRNMHRGTPAAYGSDPAAVRAARAALAQGFPSRVDPALRRFFHLPFSHSEALADQDLAVSLAEASGDADAAKWARHHRDIVARFGRFPHRNAILGRASTPEEVEWLAGEGAFKG
ncbi:DUF924 family protein [Alsobacter sp. R-9]